MSKRDIETSKEEQLPFANLRSYSIDEIMAAGGPTEFAIKIGKNPENIIKRLEKLPKDAFLTDEEVEIALKMLKESK
jgi:hypothetical protein